LFSVGTTAANALICGTGWLISIDVTVHHSLATPSLSVPTAAEVTTTLIPHEMTVEEDHADAEDWRVALHELQ